LIQVWQCLERGVTPSSALIELRMIDYIRWVGAQTGVPRNTNEFLDDGTPNPAWPPPQHVPYDTLLPLDDFRVSETR
jgi:hypothetical protein